MHVNHVVDTVPVHGMYLGRGRGGEGEVNNDNVTRAKNISAAVQREGLTR
jgi:hypothetical protein